MKRATAGLALLFLLGAVGSIATADGWREEAVLVESAHPYPNNAAGVTYAVSKPGAEKIRIFFEKVDLERNWDFLDLVDGAGQRIQRLTGRAENFWSETASGDRITLRLTSDRSTAGYGFRVTTMSYEAHHAPPGPARLELLVGGRPVETLVLEPGATAELEVRFYTTDGSAVDHSAFAPQLESATGEAVVKAEPSAQGRVRIVAGRQTVTEIPVRLYDANQPELEFKFVVTIKRSPGPMPAPGGTVAQIGFLVSDGRGGKRLLDPRETLVLSVHDQGEDHLPFEIQALDRTGHAIAPDRANVGVDISVTRWYGTLEKSCHHMYVFHSGSLASEDVKIIAFDRANQRTRGVLRIAVREPEVPDAPTITQIRFLVEESEDEWRPVGPRERITLSTHGAGADHLPFAIEAVDQNGDALSPDEVELAVQVNVVAWYGSLQQSCHHMYVFHSGALPQTGIQVTAFETSTPEVVGTMTIDTARPVACPRCGRVHAAGQGCAAPPPAQPRRVQIGETYANPSWAKSNQLMDAFFVSRADVRPLRQVILNSRGQFRIETISIRFKDYSRTTLGSPMRDYPAGTDIVFDVPAQFQNTEVDQIEVRLRARGGTEVVCFGVVGP